MIKMRKTSQRVLSAECGFTVRRIETMVSTSRLPDAIETFKIAAALGVSVEYLVTGADPHQPDLTAAIAKIESGLTDLKLQTGRSGCP
jgi:hypothetical protein